MKKRAMDIRYFSRIFGPHNLLLLSLSFFLTSLYAAGNDTLRIRQYGLDDGLSQVTVNDLLKDSDGFVWVATQDGLNRFDGNRFEQYKHREGDSMSVSGNYINTLFEDAHGNIWVGTLGNGLCWYDSERDIFHRYELPGTNRKNETISDIITGERGVIWVASRISGLHKLEPVSNGYNHSHSFAHKSLDAIFMSKNGDLWLGDVDGNIFKWESPETNETGKPQKELNVTGAVRSFYETASHLLIGTNDGLFFYDKETKEMESFEFEPGKGEPTRYVTSFLKAGEQMVWVGAGNGLYLFDWKKRIVVGKVSESENNAQGLSSNSVEALLRLSDNQIFVGTGLNLHLLDFSSPVFKNISRDQKGRRLLNYNVIFSIYKENDNLWVGTAEGGLNLIQNERVFYFKDDFLYGNIRGLAKDKVNQRLWIATTRGLGMIDLPTFDPHNPEFKIFLYDPNNDNSISGDEVLDVVIDKNQNVWGGTYGRGIFRLSLDKDGEARVERFKHNSKNANSLINDYVHCVAVDTENNVWVGTEEGVSKLTAIDNEAYKFINFSKTSDASRSLSANSVLDILVDDSGRVWIGAQHGLNRVFKNGEIQSWAEQKQFPNAVVYSIQDDEKGNLWLGTNNGIVRFDPVDEKFTHYGIEDGIQSKEFDIHARFRDKHGNIYLGGVNGITYFHPEDLNKLDKPQPLYFSQLRVKDQEVIPSGGQLLETALRKTNKLEVREGQFPFYLQFSTIDFRFNKNIDFAYKLLPADEEWNLLKAPEIQFLNLPSGDYTLLVNGFSRGEPWEATPLQMKLSILPPWYGAWWAYAAYIAMAALLIYWFYRFQLSKKLALAESERLKEIHQLKNCLYTNITHEFRTPLTVILGMTDSLKDNGKDRDWETSARSLEMIERNGAKLLQLVNEMLDLAKLEGGSMKLQQINADVVPFIKYLCESFQSFAGESNINLVVYSEIDELIMDFDTTKLSAIISNLLSNAIKFTPEGGKIIVHLKLIGVKNKDYFFVKVKDTGIGISEEALPHIFNRFYQVEHNSSEYGEGTGIGLALTKELVEFMGGTIDAKSTLGKGSEFVIRLPVSHTANEAVETPAPLKPERPVIPEEKPLTDEASGADGELPLALIIEDSTDVAYYLKTCLKGKYKILHAQNGSLGLDMAYEHIPDVVICDVMMPEKNGFEVCSTLKSDERTDHIPVIMLTAKVTAKDRLSGLAHGADAYLAKPFSLAELQIRLDQLIQLRKRMIGKIQDDGFSTFLKRKVENPETKFLQKAIKIIHTEMDNDLFGPANLARELCLSESQIYRKLKAISGKSTAIFIRSVRLQRAKELLQTTNKTIAETAYEVGFNDPSWFSRAFKEEFGFAPSAMHK